MELFVVNRYTGNEEDSKENTYEGELRKKLLEKINQRKRLNETLVENISEHKGKRKKVSESENGSDQQVGLSESGYLVSTVLLTKKNKLKGNISKSTGVECNEYEASSSKKKKNKINTDQVLEIGEENDEEGYNENNSSDVKEKDAGPKSFTILHDPQLSKKNKVKRKLPDWLANPSVVSVDLKNLTCKIDCISGLDSIFIDKLRENGITHFFPVQQQVIPCLLQTVNRPKMYWPNDICVSAPTGSGKTLAFVLPILQILYKRILPRIRALVVLPVQDLANQVYQVFKTYSQPTNLNVLLLSKIRDFKEEQELICQKDGLGNYKILVDIVVTTAGRLVEHLIKTEGLSFSDLKFLVIDEADKVMDNMQNDWLYHLNKHINSECTRAYQVPIITYNNLLTGKRPPHKLLFSATLSQDPEKLQQLGLFHPKLYTSVVKSENVTNGDDVSKFIGKYTTPAELKEFYSICTKANKPLVLHHLINSKSWTNILCFVNSSLATTKLAFILKHMSNNEVKVKQLSSNLTVKERNSVIQAFHKGKINVLISSDALARGIDIPNVRYVISYECPPFVKTYIHRVGRTGRAGKEGTSLTLLTSKEVGSFNKMISSAGKSSISEIKMEEEALKDYESAYEKALTSLAEFLENQKIRSLENIKKKKKLQTLASKGKFMPKKKYKGRKSGIFRKKKNPRKLK